MRIHRKTPPSLLSHCATALKSVFAVEDSTPAAPPFPTEIDSEDPPREAAKYVVLELTIRDPVHPDLAQAASEASLYLGSYLNLGLSLIDWKRRYLEGIATLKEVADITRAHIGKVLKI